MLPQIVPGFTLETATLFSLGCLVLGSYESKKVFRRKCLNEVKKGKKRSLVKKILKYELSAIIL